MAITVLKQTETLAVIKVTGTGGTVELATTLLSPTMIIQGTPTVNITFAQWNISAGLSDNINITRGGVSVLNLQANGSTLDLSGNNGVSDTVGNTSDLVCTITGVGEAYITLRKAAGYKSKVEPEIYGQYDNPNVVGA